MRLNGNNHNRLNDIEIILRALDFAACKHLYQRRNDNRRSPYINHLITVACLLWEKGGVYDIDTIVSAILHDTLEDTHTSKEEIESLFGDKVYSIVKEVTNDRNLSKEERKKAQIETATSLSFESRCIRLADKISNIEDIANFLSRDRDTAEYRQYVDWAEKVVDNLRGTNLELENYFDSVCFQARQRLREEESSGIK